MICEKPAGPGGLLRVDPIVNMGQLVSLKKRALLLYPMTATAKPIFRLRKHADYQRVYKGSRKRFGKQMSYFFLLRESHGVQDSESGARDIAGPRVGLTVGKAMGNAVQRNRIKRRMREAVRRQLALLQTEVDIVLHPQRRVIDLDFAALERDVASVFQAVRKAGERHSTPSLPAVD